MKLKKITKIFTSILTIIGILITLFPANCAFAEEPIPYTAPTITRFYPTNPNILHIDISFPVEQNDDVSKLYVRAFYEYTVNGNVYRVDKYEASISAYDDETGVYDDLMIQLAPNMGGLYDVYAVAGAIYSDGTIVETDPQKVPAGLLPWHDVDNGSTICQPIKVDAFVRTDDNGNPVYNRYEFGHGYGTVEDNPLANEDVETENASISYHDNVLTLSGYFGDISITQPWTGYDVTKLVLNNAHFETLSTSTHKPLNIEVIGYSSGVIWFDNGTDILMTAAPGQPEMPTFSGPLISHGASGTDVSVAILSNIRYLAHSDDADPARWYRTIGMSAMAFDNCDVEITNTNNFRTAISTSDHTLASSASLWTRINGSSLIVKDSDFRIYSDANAISIGNSYPYGLQDMLTADVVFDNSRAEILLGLTDKSSYTTAIYKSAATGTLDVKNGSSLKIYSNKTGGYTAAENFNTVHVDKTSEMLIDLKTPYNEALSARYLMGITSTYQNSLIDIEGRLNISLENGYENSSTPLRGIRCNGTINFHNGADVDIDVKGGKELYGIDIYGSDLNVNNADLDITILSDPTSTSRSYGINSTTNTLSNSNVKIDMQGGYCYNLYARNLTIDNTNLEIGLHRGLDTITKYSSFEPFYVSSASSTTLTGNNTITVRVPEECYNYVKSDMEEYFPGVNYDLGTCICEPGSINSQCIKKKSAENPGTMSAAIYLDADSNGMYMDEEKVNTFACDQQKLILDIRNFLPDIPDGGEVKSLAFYPADGSSQSGTVFWFAGDAEHPCDNGTPHDKLENGVFQLVEFSPNGNMPVDPGEYKILAYAGNGNSENYQETLYYSDETFTITKDSGEGESGTLEITTSSLPTGFVDLVYSQQLTASKINEADTLTYSLASGSSLPLGLELNQDGVISGTPTTAGSTAFTVVVTEKDRDGQETGTATKEFTITIKDKFEIITQTLPEAIRGVYYDQTLLSNYTGAVWSIKDGKLPAGLQLSSNGRIYGICAQDASGTYTFTVKAEADSQSAEKTFSITAGDTFVFTTSGTDSDAIGRYCYLKAKQGENNITLWSGKYSENLSISVPARYAGATVTDVQLTTSLYPSGNVVLAQKSEETSLVNGGSTTLTAADEPLITLPEITHNYGANVRVSYKDANSCSFNAGDLVARNGTYTMYAYAYTNDKDFVLAYDTDKGPIFTVGDEEKNTYTYGDLGKSVSMTYPTREKKSVTFTLVQEEGFEGDVPDLSGAGLSFHQSVKNKNHEVTAKVQEGNTVTAELYTGFAASVTLYNNDLYCLTKSRIDSVDGDAELTYRKNRVTSAAVRVTARLADGISEDFKEYAAQLDSSYIRPSITCSDKTWKGGNSQTVKNAMQNELLKFNMYHSNSADALYTLIQSGGTYDLSWEDNGAVLAGKVEGFTWEKNNLYTDAEITLNLKGGLLLEIDYSKSTAYQSMYGWWYDKENHSWIRDNKTTIVYPRVESYAFPCPNMGKTYHFILLSSGMRPTGMTWEEAVATYSEMPHFEDIRMENNTVSVKTATLERRYAASDTYATLPDSTLVGPEQFSDVDEAMTFTGHIELDEGLQGNMTAIRIEAAGTDSGSRVATQITSVVVDGKKYPYTKIELSNETLPGQLVSKQFTTYYQITFDEPVKLPCDITIYGKSMRTSSDCVLDVTAKLDIQKYNWQPVGTAIAKAPAISVEMASSTSGKTVSAYLTVPKGKTVDIYDGNTLVLSNMTNGEIEIPLSGTFAGRASTHEITFRWSDPEDTSSEPISQTVIHADGVPKLTKQYLQYSYSGGLSWANVNRNSIYSYTSADPPQFRLTCTVENSENLAGGVVFSVARLDGTVSYMGTKQTGNTFVTEAFTGSPVIGAVALYEPDWDKVNAVLQAEMPPLPTDSPSKSKTDFAETIVIPYEEHKVQFEEKPAVSDEEMKQLTEEMQEFQNQIEEIYRNHGGQAGFYLIDLGTGQFLPAIDMINGLDTGNIPQGETGTTTMARSLNQEQLSNELGSGEWSRYSFTEPGESGGSTSTGLEVYTQSVTTEGGVSGTITIATDGQGNTLELTTAQGEGTGTNPYTLPESGTYPSTSTGGFSFTSFESDGMSVFTNVCGDVVTGSGIIKDITGLITNAEATGAFGALERGLGIYTFGNDMIDGMNKQLSLADLLNAPNSWLSSPCAQKLSPAYRQNMQRQIDQFIKDVRDAEAWNMTVTGANYVLGAGGLFGLVNPVAGIIGGAASWSASKITSQKIDNVQKQAVLLQDMIDLQIEKTARVNNDPECMGKSNKGKRQPYNVCIDPSGTVYEAVLSNPIEGATVKLYSDGIEYKPVYPSNADGLPTMVDENGEPVAPSNAAEAGDAVLSEPEENSTIPAEHVLTTAANGKFQWMVQEGLWYVTAEKEGYEPGNSGNDKAAVVRAGNTQWLPVEPEQLDINIPLISYDAPEAEIAYRTDGVYISFSKYMVDTTLTAENFTLTIDGGKTVDFTVEKLNREQAPANINYDGEAPYYTSQIKLAAALAENAEVSLEIGAEVMTYAGVSWGKAEAFNGRVEKAAALEKPVFSINGGTVDYGAMITITGPDGAQIYYTTDGSEPDADNGTRYYGENILLNADVTIKVLAVKTGTSSEVAMAMFEVSPADDGSVIGDPENQPESGNEDDPAPSGGGGSGGGGTSSYTVKFDTQDGSAIKSVSVSRNGTVHKPEDPVREGYTFAGWFVDKECTTAYDFDAKVTRSFTLYAKWTAKEVDVTEWENPFTDVKESDWFYGNVRYVCENGLFAGISNTEFAPNTEMTRAMLVTVLYRAEGEPVVTENIPFTDAGMNEYYTNAVIWAAANGIVKGYGENIFAPNDNVTREQIAAIMERYADFKGIDTSQTGDLSQFTDEAGISAWARENVSWAVGTGLISGKGKGVLDPSGNATRAEVAAILQRFLEKETT